MERGKKRAIYPGSFDPITFGHIDIALRSLKIFDELIIAIGDNRNKDPLFSKSQRIARSTRYSARTTRCR